MLISKYKYLNNTVEINKHYIIRPNVGKNKTPFCVYVITPFCWGQHLSISGLVCKYTIDLDKSIRYNKGHTIGAKLKLSALEDASL